MFVERASLIASVLLACKSTEPPPPPPAPVHELGEIMRRTFVEAGGAFVPGELTFNAARSDGTFGELVITTRRRVTRTPFNVDDLYNCPTTTWRGGVPAVVATGSCATYVALQRPRCSLIEIWARAIEERAPATALATMTLVNRAVPFHDGQFWQVMIGSERYEYDDDCAGIVEQGGTIARRLPKQPSDQPVSVDGLTRAATEWLTEKHPTLIANQIRAIGVRSDGTLDPDLGGYAFFPGIAWPDGKPLLDLYHYGGRAPYGICNELTWTTMRGWRLDIDAACADIDRSPTCPITTVWRRAIADGLPQDKLARIAFDGGWEFQLADAAKVRYSESDLRCE